MIYFIRDAFLNRIKIGTTIRLSERLKKLQVEYGGELEVIAVLNGGHSEEWLLHDRFAHLRAVGEWFEPGDDLLGFIVSDGKPWDGLDDVPPPKRQIVGLRGTDAYKAWLVEFAEAQRSDVADLIDDALEAYAKERGFKAPPKR